MDENIAKAQEIAGRLVSLNEIPGEGPNKEETTRDLAGDAAQAIVEFLDRDQAEELELALAYCLFNAQRGTPRRGG
jgi:hypothetical protein